MTSAPTWTIEASFSSPLVGRRVYILDGGTERADVCGFQTDAAGLATSAVCSQADSTTLPLTHDGPLQMFVQVNLPRDGVADDRLVVSWRASAQTDTGTDLDPVTSTHTLEGTTVADVGVRTVDLGGGRLRIEFEILDEATSVPVTVTTDAIDAELEGCPPEPFATEISCETTLLANGFPLAGVTGSEMGFARIALNGAAAFSVDPNPDNDEVHWMPGSGGGGGGCSTSPTGTHADAWLVALVLIALRIRRRRGR